MLVPPFTQLDAPRLVLRRLREEDVPALVSYRADPVVARYQSWSHYDVEQACALVGEMQDREPGQAGWFQFGIALRDGGALVGDCALHVDELDPRLGEVGFTLSRAHQGRGLATEAVGALLGYAFTVLGLHRVSALTDARNDASVAVLERLGMRREAHFRQASWFKGAWCDEYRYALLAQEWAELGVRSAMGRG